MKPCFLFNNKRFSMLNMHSAICMCLHNQHNTIDCLLVSTPRVFGLCLWVAVNYEELIASNYAAVGVRMFSSGILHSFLRAALFQIVGFIGRNRG